MRLDMIDLSQAEVSSGDCPDVRSWPIGTSLNGVTFAQGERYERGNVMLEFKERDTLPPAIGTQGPISYTLWGGCYIAGVWRILPWVECIKQYIPTGDLLVPGQLPSNILYYARPPLLGYQPSPGEKIALFVTTGDTRRQNAQVVQPWRSSVVTVPFQVGQWSWSDETVVVEPPVVTQPPQVQPNLLEMLLAQNVEIFKQLRVLETLLQTPPIYDAPYLGALRPRRGPSGVDRG